MPADGDVAPEFTAPLATGDIESFSLSDALEHGPVVLAFFPGAFTSVCSHEISAFDDRLGEFEDAGAQVVGVSRDTPFSLNEFRQELGVAVDLASDLNRDAIEEYGIEMDFDELGVYGVAKRSVFVVDTDGEIAYEWVSDDPGVEPDYDEVLAAVEDLD
ncbi:alkyl hydroperoxide reductase/ thiol specific antioxidant/ Mal allergen [Salinarchaeum sp. Harcht-Bsk1]|uniref:redoxin domain-containing protein n=1 Tax=Salinarchaeum sp. Harcht-Bsk1 TaxID=1333523 RepID=UPI000342297C|nr:redoxin domain-containing protein [Salinarchaeum sp. Harcht-Bsk1]AGN02069.1 alkyl hydroperoxide reductase/ thiol specific antioxidant/ Mal allergen [Salinarchaeum sp. Harcht-Bsk1]